MTKLKKSKSKSFNIKNYFDDESEANKKNESIYLHIIKEFGPDIPIMKKVHKQEESFLFHFSSYSRFKTYAEEISVRCRPIFRTMSDVYRAAFYLGMSLIYHKMINEEGVDRIPAMENLLVLEKIYSSYHTVDDYLTILFKIKDMKDKGHLDNENFTEMVNEVVNGSDAKLKPILEEKVVKMLKGANKAQLLENRIQGRPPVSLRDY